MSSRNESVPTSKTLDCNASDDDEINLMSDNSGFKELIGRRKNPSKEITNIFPDSSSKFSLGDSCESINFLEPGFISENDFQQSSIELSREYIDKLKRKLLNNKQTGNNSNSKSCVDSTSLFKNAQSRISILKAKYKNQPFSRFKPNEKLCLLKKTFLNTRLESFSYNSKTEKSSDDSVSLLEAKRKDLVALNEKYKLLITQGNDTVKNADNSIQNEEILSLETKHSDPCISSYKSSVREKDLSKTAFTSTSRINRNNSETKMKESYECNLTSGNKLNLTESNESSGVTTSVYSLHFVENLKAQKIQELYQTSILQLKTNKYKVEQSMCQRSINNDYGSNLYHKKKNAIQELVDKFKNSQVKRNPITKAKNRILNNRHLILHKKFLASRTLLVSDSKLTLSKQCTDKDPSRIRSIDGTSEISVPKSGLCSAKICQAVSTEINTILNCKPTETSKASATHENHAATNTEMKTHFNYILVEESKASSTHENNTATSTEVNMNQNLNCIFSKTTIASSTHENIAAIVPDMKTYLNCKHKETTITSSTHDITIKETNSQSKLTTAVSKSKDCLSKISQALTITEININKNLNYQPPNSSQHKGSHSWAVINAEELPKMKRLVLKLQRLPPEIMSVVSSNQNTEPSCQDVYNLNEKKICSRKGKKPETTNKESSIDGFGSHFFPVSTENVSPKLDAYSSPTLTDSNVTLASNENTFVSDSNSNTNRKHVNLKRKYLEANLMEASKTCRSTGHDWDRLVDKSTDNSSIFTESSSATKHKKKKRKSSKKKRKLVKSNGLSKKGRRTFRKGIVDSGMVMSQVLSDNACSSIDTKRKTFKIANFKNSLTLKETRRDFEKRDRILNTGIYRPQNLTNVNNKKEIKESNRGRNLYEANEIVPKKKTQSCIENCSDTITDSDLECCSMLMSSSEEGSSNNQTLLFQEVSSASSGKTPSKNVPLHSAFDNSSSKQMQPRSDPCNTMLKSVGGKHKSKKGIAIPCKELRVRLFKLPYLPRKIRIPLKKLPNIIFEKHEAGKPIMLSSVMPLLQADSNINNPEIVKSISFSCINSSILPEEERIRPKKLRVNLIKLPDYIYRNYTKGKPIMLSNILPSIYKVESVSIFNNSFIKTENC